MRFRTFFQEHPYVTLFGEWLVPHTLKTYRDDAWRKFYVFDVVRDNDTYVPYEEYSEWLKSCDIDFIPPISFFSNFH